MKKGFTLIELIAVIVILAIIALIATPIILGIINDARKESNERSAELYASAVRNAVAAYQLTGTTAPTKFSDLDIQYDGEVECATEELYEDGSFYIADCTVNGTEVEYTYGTQQVTQVYKPQYYYFGFDWTGIVGKTAAPENPSSITPSDKSYYIGYDVTDDVVSTVYICFMRKDIEYCLKGTTDGSAFTTNTEIIKDAYADVVDTDACVFGTEQMNYSYCAADGINVDVGSDGYVNVDDNNSVCSFNTSDFSFLCEKW